MLFSVVAVLLALSLILSTVFIFAIELDGGSSSRGSGGGGSSSQGSSNGGGTSQGGSLNEGSGGGSGVGSSYSGSKTDLPYVSSAPSRSNYSLSVPAGTTQIEGIASQYAVLVDVSSYSVIAELKAAEKVYPASMTKIMTVLVASEQIVKQGIKLDELLTVKQAHVDYQQKMGASGNLGFVAGDQVTVENLLYLVNYKSDTIACLLLAERIAGSEAKFVDMMNAKVNAMGLSGTHFVNSTGLYDDDHYTTCADMAAIMAYCLDNQMAKKVITSYVGRSIPIYQNDRSSPVRAPMVYSGWYSERLGDDPYAGNGIKITGGKTGYETIPKCSFVTCAEDTESKKTYICVVVGDTSAAQNAASTRTVYRDYTN